MSESYTIEGLSELHVEDEIADLLIGRKIVDVDVVADKITLDDGTTLMFMSTAERCAWFEAAIKNHKIIDHVITDVQYNDVDGDDEAPRQFHLHILAEGITVADVHVSGDEGSGYYVHSVNVTVEQP